MRWCARLALQHGVYLSHLRKVEDGRADRGGRFARRCRSHLSRTARPDIAHAAGRGVTYLSRAFPLGTSSREASKAEQSRLGLSPRKAPGGKVISSATASTAACQLPKLGVPSAPSNLRKCGR